MYEANDEVYDVETHEGDLYYAARGEIVRLTLPETNAPSPEGGGNLTGTSAPGSGWAALATVLAALATASRP